MRYTILQEWCYGNRKKGLCADKTSRLADSNAGKRQFGFTLVELLVVISIIALLLAILMPSLQKAREQAKSVVCKSNLKQQSLALRLYANDNRGKLPQADEFGNVIRPYLSIDKNLVNPLSGGSKYMWCPSQKMEYNYSSYGLNWVNVFSSIGDTWVTGAENAAFELSRHLDRVPGKVFLIADGSYGWICPPTRWVFDKDTDGDKVKDTNWGAWRKYGDVYKYNGFAARHMKTGNFLMGDGSVRSLNLMSWITNDGGVWGKPERP